MRIEIFKHIHRLSLSYYAKNEAGDVMSRLTNDMDTLQQALSFALVQVVRGGMLIVWLVYVMFSAECRVCADQHGDRARLW